MRLNPYETLAIPQNATKEQVRENYKLLSKKYHPDGGTEPDGEKMAAINNAHEVLVDDEKRDLFDRFNILPGDSIDEVIEDRAAKNLTRLMEAILGRANEPEELNYIDIIGRMHTAVESNQHTLRQGISVMMANIKRLECIKEIMTNRMTIKDGKYAHAIFFTPIDVEIEKLNVEIVRTQNSLKVLERVHIILNNYEYAADAPPPAPEAPPAPPAGNDNAVKANGLDAPAPDTTKH